MKRLELAGVLVAVVISLAAVPVRVQAEEPIDKETYDKMVELIKEELREGEFDSEEDARNAIKKAEDKYDVEITQDEEDKILDVVDTVNALGLDNDELADKVDEIYNNLDGDLSDNLDEAIDQVIDEAKQELVDQATTQVENAVKKSFLDYFKDFKVHIAKIFSRLFGVSVG